MNSKSTLQMERQRYQPSTPSQLRNILEINAIPQKNSFSTDPEIAARFPQTNNQPILEFSKSHAKVSAPLKVAVVLSGGQAPGGHNVIAGIYDALMEMNGESVLYGFLEGPKGVLSNNSVQITKEKLESYRNQGGFDIIGSGRTKIEKASDLSDALNTVRALMLNGLIIIGGDDSNTNAALLAEYFAANQCPTCVIGIPKTIDGDLRNNDIEQSFGFDTASKNFSETIGNLMKDALSSKKYYFFIKLMGRSASHITLECALQTHPNLALISEEVYYKKQTLSSIVESISELIVQRSNRGKDYGVFLIPEGVIEFIPEVKKLIEELNRNIAKNIVALENKAAQEQLELLLPNLSPASQECLKGLPHVIQCQLVHERDPHGNVQVSQIETERLLSDMVKERLMQLKKEGRYKGNFASLRHFCGYEGRSCFPSIFDCNYCYSLGKTAILLVSSKANGYLSVIKNLGRETEFWQPFGIPLTSLLTIEERSNQRKAVIKKALVDLDQEPFTTFNLERESWSLEDKYISPGPMQFYGPNELTNSITYTLELRKNELEKRASKAS